MDGNGQWTENKKIWTEIKNGWGLKNVCDKER